MRQANEITALGIPDLAFNVVFPRNSDGSLADPLVSSFSFSSDRLRGHDIPFSVFMKQHPYPDRQTAWEAFDTYKKEEAARLGLPAPEYYTFRGHEGTWIVSEIRGYAENPQLTFVSPRATRALHLEDLNRRLTEGSAQRVVEPTTPDTPQPAPAGDGGR